MAFWDLPSKATLSLRGLSVLFLIASAILLIMVKSSDKSGSTHDRTYRYTYFSSYKYMLGTGVIGIAYNLLQIISFAIFRNKDSNVYSLIKFYGDMALSYILATGAAAGFGATSDLKNEEVVKFGGAEMTGFFKIGYASAILLFLAFLCTAILCILSYYARTSTKV